MRTIKTLFLGFLAASMICGCSSVSVSSNVSYEDQSWNEFIGKHNGQIGMVVAAPEVNDSGENVNSHVKVSKPETKRPRNTVMPSAEVPYDASAEVCLEKWLKSFQKNDWAQVICLSTGLFLNEKPDNEEGAISYVLSEIEWKIKESTVVNDNAKFTVEVTVPDTLEAIISEQDAVNIIIDNVEEPEGYWGLPYSCQGKITKDGKNYYLISTPYGESWIVSLDGTQYFLYEK